MTAWQDDSGGELYPVSSDTPTRLAVDYSKKGENKNRHGKSLLWPRKAWLNNTKGNACSAY